MRKQGKADSTIRGATQKLKQLSKMCDIQNPEEVKGILANLNWKKSSKFGAVIDLTAYYKFLKIEWKKPKYKPVRELPFIPTEEELDIVISAPRNFLSTLLLLLKETGVRYGEALTIKWEDVDFERRIVRIKPEKNSNPRMLPLSIQLINMLNKIPRKSEIVFYKNPKTIRNSFSYAKNHTAEKLQNPRIKKITFHTFRHWKGTTEYHKTRDIIHVKSILGHKSIQSTMFYINIESALFCNTQEEFITKTAKTVDEALKLIEVGFEYVTEMEGLKLFRKRK